ncbi:MAG TPA: hypothetical protein VL371_10015 [Gemmataceae bacterium]|jgi:hypothetical protein|nr:hypothetical protein [Gemmataceae bacterium]
MNDGLELLGRDEQLYQLLSHYHAAAGDDRERWLDRVTDWRDGRPEDVTRWHGRLLASAWLEQNTGHTPPPTNGRIGECYRVTAAGRKALKCARERNEDDEELAPG